MSQIKTYPKMNETIKDLLRHSENPMQLYILARIEELEKQVSDLTPPPNDPLTLEQLREMAGEPVWIVSHPRAEWNIIHSFHPDDVVGGGVITTRRTAEKRIYPYVDYGKTWRAYRRKLEDGTS